MFSMQGYQPVPSSRSIKSLPKLDSIKRNFYFRCMGGKVKPEVFAGISGIKLESVDDGCGCKVYLLTTSEKKKTSEVLACIEFWNTAVPLERIFLQPFPNEEDNKFIPRKAISTTPIAILLEAGKRAHKVGEKSTYSCWDKAQEDLRAMPVEVTKLDSPKLRFLFRSSGGRIKPEAFAKITCTKLESLDAGDGFTVYSLTLLEKKRTIQVVECIDLWNRTVPSEKIVFRPFPGEENLVGLTKNGKSMSKVVEMFEVCKLKQRMGKENSYFCWEKPQEESQAMFAQIGDRPMYCEGESRVSQSKEANKRTVQKNKFAFRTTGAKPRNEMFSSISITQMEVAEERNGACIGIITTGRPVRANQVAACFTRWNKDAPKSEHVYFQPYPDDEEIVTFTKESPESQHPLVKRILQEKEAAAQCKPSTYYQWNDAEGEILSMDPNKGRRLTRQLKMNMMPLVLEPKELGKRACSAREGAAIAVEAPVKKSKTVVEPLVSKKVSSVPMETVIIGGKEVVRRKKRAMKRDAASYEIDTESDAEGEEGVRKESGEMVQPVVEAVIPGVAAEPVVEVAIPSVAAEAVVEAPVVSEEVPENELPVGKAQLIGASVMGEDVNYIHELLKSKDAMINEKEARMERERQLYEEIIKAKDEIIKVKANDLHNATAKNVFLESYLGDSD